MTTVDAPRSTPGTRGATGPGVTRADISVAGLVTLRLIGAGPDDRRAVEHQFGPAGPAGREPADVTIRYVDRIGADGELLRYLGPGVAGFTDDGFLLLRGRFRREVRVLLPGAEVGGRCEVRCEHGVGRVPHLVALVNLALLAAGGVALHASAYEEGEHAVVATGWSKGGKTEALLAATSRGARHVADEWVHIRPDRQVSGTFEPVRVWDWQLQQLTWLRPRVPLRDRVRLHALRLAERAADRAHASARLGTAVARQRFVDLPPHAIARVGRAPDGVPLGRLLLMTSTDGAATWSREVSGREVADRMAASLEAERLPLAEVLAAHRYAFPATTTELFDRARHLELHRLRTLLDDVPAREVLHPYPVDLAVLGAACDEGAQP